MVEKTGDERTDYLIDKEWEIIQAIIKSAKEQGEEIRKLIERFHESRAKRLGRQID